MEKECKKMEALEVYVQMKEEYRISRNIRASWYFGNLNKYINVKNPEEESEASEELQVLSVISKKSQQPHPYSPGCQCKFKLLPSTHVTFLAKRYRFVIVLDLSPSMATVDVLSGRISLLDIYACLSKCLRGLTRPFCVPGTRTLLAPKLFVTVIAYTPLAALTTQQVMVQGCLLTMDNLDVFLEKLQDQLDEFENKIVNNMFDKEQDDQDQTGDARPFDRTSYMDNMRANTAQNANDKGKQEEPDIATPEAGFVNMLWCGILALQLLPENSAAGIIVVTDGVTAMPDAAATNALLSQMRSSTIACSFLQVGKGFHPHCSFGYIPHTEIMQFLATATFGAFLSKCSEVELTSSQRMNQYHKAFLSWHFQKGLDGMKIDSSKRHQHELISSDSGWSSEGIQPSFTVNKHGACTIPLITKKHMDVTLHTSLSNVLSVRLREGYTIKDVNITKNEKQHHEKIEVKLALPWKYNGRIEYKATSLWPLSQNSNITAVEVIMEGSYEFLRDVTCPQRGPPNTFRAKVVRNFWNTLKSLRDTDQLLVHLQSFATNPIYYTVPEGTRKGMPLFYMPPNCDTPVLAQKLDKKDSHVVQFAEFWKRITLMDSKRWQRWLHTHRLALLLVPDLPLPKYLYLPSSNGRYNSIQCRVALKELNSILRDISTFILLENHSYITLMHEDPKGPPTSFYLVRISSKAPGVVIRLGFLGGTPGHVRNTIVNELREKLEALTLTQKLSLIQESGFVLRLQSRTTQQQLQQGITGRPCVVMLSRPMDMILVKYEKMPADFTDLKTSITVTVASVPVYMQSHTPDKTLNRLACYLHHQRWIWDAQSDNNTPISAQAVANVLSVLTKVRLQEGFHFAYSNAGIISFVTELHMKNPMQLRIGEKEEEGSDKEQQFFPCFVQYILFPPHTTTFVRERIASGLEHWGNDLIDDSDTAEADGRLQLVTECWIEPQSGTVFDLPPEQKHFHNATYKEIPSAMLPIDHEVITTLLTYEHLKSHCSGMVYNQSPVMNPLRASPSRVGNLQLSESISHIPFQLDLMKLVNKCQQVEVLCSTFIEDQPQEAEPDAQQPEDQGNQPSFPKPNDTLFFLLLDALKRMTSHEVLLTSEESMEFARAILARDRKDKAPPFELTESKIGDMSEFINKQRQSQTQQGESGSQLNDSHSSFNPESSGFSREQQEEEQQREESPIPQWSCYVHNVEASTSQLILTFIPATYRDLQKLMTSPAESSPEDQPEEDEGVESAKDEKEKVESGAAVVSLDSAAPGDVDEDMATKGDEVASENVEEVKDVDKDACEADGGGGEERADEAAVEPEVQQGNAGNKTKKPLVLPIYMYDCSMTGLKSYLLDPSPNPQIKFADIFDDKTFSRSYADGRSGRPSFSRQNSRTQSTSSSTILEEEDIHKAAQKSYEEKEKESHKPPVCSKAMERFHLSLAHEIHKSFGLGIYQSLQRGQHISAYDVQAAMEEICDEASNEIDITEFVLSVCDHVREYASQQVAASDDEYNEHLEGDSKEQLEDDSSKDQIEDVKDLSSTQVLVESEQSKWDETDSSGTAEDKTDESKDENSDALTEDSSPRLRFSSDKFPQASVTIPMASLYDAHKCNTTSGLHQLIQQHFQHIMGKHFKPVPTNKDFWYYSVDQVDGVPDVEQEEDGDGDDKDTDTATVESDANVPQTTLPTRKSSSEYPTVVEEELPNDDLSEDEDTWKADTADSKINSIMDVYQNTPRHSSDGDDDDDDYSIGGAGTSNESVMGSVKDDQATTPLFIHLVCEIKVKTNAEYKSVQTIPTCLSGLITFLEKAPTESVDLADVSVTLDLMSLTLPPDEVFEEELDLLSDRSREMSLTEQSPPASPVPQEDQYGERHGRTKTTSSSSGGGLGNLTMPDALYDLPLSQKTAIEETVAEIKWLLKDEIASAKCDIFPPTMETLEMVAQHVKESLGKTSCIAEEVALQFVFGADQSLEKFQEQFELLEIPSYQLNKVGDYYHIMMDKVYQMTDEESLHNALRSLSEQEPHRLVDGKSEVIVPPSQASSSKSSTMVICTPPSPVKEANEEAVEEESIAKNEGEDKLPFGAYEDVDPGGEAGGEASTGEQKTDGKGKESDGSRVSKEDNAPAGKSDDEVQSSDSEIRILAEDHFGDGKPDVAKVAEFSSATQALSTSDTDLPTSRPETHVIPESDESTLRRNSASFIVLSKEAHDKDEKEDQSPDSAEEALEASTEVPPPSAPSTEVPPPSDTPSADHVKQDVDDSKDAVVPGTRSSRPASSSSKEADVPATRSSRPASSSSAPDASSTDGTTPAKDSASNTSVFKTDLSATTSPRLDSSEGESTTQKSKLRHTSGVSARSSASGPPSSQLSYASLNGSFNEYDDGYEASSSDNEADEASCDVTGPPLIRQEKGMPNFWLIMRIHSSKVDVFFHARDLGNQDQAFSENKEVYNRVTENIRNICRQVNQRLLLQDLHETRMCKSLLVAESEEDIWRGEESSKGRTYKHSSDFESDDLDQEPKDYLAAATEFNPGHFACDEIWYTLLPVHSRLKSSNRGGAASRGLQSVKQTLTAFGVTNRKNMFVYKGKTDEVFYLRLSESTILNYDSSRHGSLTESSSKLTTDALSRATSQQSLNTTVGSAVFDDDHTGSLEGRGSFESRRSTIAVDSGMETISNSIRSSVAASGHYRSDHCIKLTVHGIAGPGQPGPEIQEELVQVLKNRLDDTTLDVISAMLARNPMLKLTPDDIQFIQSYGKDPTDSVLCTIPDSATQYLFSLNYYLRQNLRQFLNPPKYIDARSENHFKAKCDVHEHSSAAHTENNIFLYNRPHESGRTGIACISLCIVDSKGNPMKRTFTRPSLITYVDPVKEADFERHTTSERYLPEGDVTAEPKALIEFAIWERGNVDLEHLTESLQKAVCDTLCDIVMEFRILTAPLGLYSKDADDGAEVEVRKKDASPTAPEPTLLPSSSSPRITPSGVSKLLIHIDRERANLSGSIKDKMSSPKSPTGKGKLTWQEHELERRHDEMARQKQREAAVGLHGNMHPIFSQVCLPWMEFENQLAVPTIQKMTAELSCRFSIEPVLRELLAKIPSLCTDFTTKLYQECGQEYKLCNWTKPSTPNEGSSSQKPRPGVMQNFFLVARNVQHWDCSLDYPSHEDFTTLSGLDNPVTRKGLQQFTPLLLTKSAGSAGAETDQDGVMESGGQNSRKFLVPRQHLLFIFISDRQMTFLTYNINGELQNGLENLFKGVVNWQNSRSELLNCILSQKMGLFSNQDDISWSLEEVDNLIKHKTPPKEPRRSTFHKPTRRLHQKTTRHPELPPFEETLRNRKIQRPIQNCSYSAAKDPVLKHGTQVQEIAWLSKKEAEVQEKLQDLYIKWQKKKRGSFVKHPISQEILELLKQSSQVVHYCATPLLFVPNWKQKITTDYWLDEDAYGEVTAEAWLMDIRTSFVQQYVQFLKTLQFSPVEITTQSPHMKRIGLSKDGKKEASRNHHASNGHHLQLTVPGGIILIEIAFKNAYFCVKLYAFESSKVPAGKAVNPQLSMLFTDECDKFKDQIHLHSFSYDFHLRTLQTYLNAPEMGFKSRYHVTNFLVDLENYYKPVPNFRRNHMHVEAQVFLSHNTPATQLYKYLMTNKPPLMKQLSMSSASGADKELEHALYQIYPIYPIFKDMQGRSVYDEFLVSLVLTWDKDDYKNQRANSMLLEGDIGASAVATSTDSTNPNLMKLKFYVLVTSRKELFPRRVIRTWQQKISASEAYFKDNSYGYQLTHQEAQNAKEKIVTMVKQAADDCRRDTLWQQLLIWDTDEDLSEKKKKKKDSSVSDDLSDVMQMTYPNFKVLLDHVHHVPFSEYDQQIVPLLNSSHQWYEGLLQYLRSKFITASRYLTSEDGQIKHLAILNPSHLDMMVLLTVDQQTNTFELEAIFKKSPSQLHAAGPEYTTAQDLFTQRHVEGIVNAVSCYLWTTLL